MNDISEDGYVDVVLPKNLIARMHYVGPDGIVVYTYIKSRINLDQYWKTNVMEAFPGIDDIAEHTHMNRIRVMRAVDKLEYLGYISVTRNLRRVNHYFIMPGIDNKREFIARYQKYSQKEEERKIPSRGWPTRRPHSPH